MKRVLSRKVSIEGKDFPEGTAIDEIPEGNRASVIGTGWTRLVKEIDEPTEPNEPELSDNVDNGDNSDSHASDGADDPPAESQGVDQTDEASTSDDEQDLDEVVDDSPSIESLGLADDIVTKLKAAGVETVDQGFRFLADQGSFRTISGIGKVTDKLIQTTLNEANS